MDIFVGRQPILNRKGTLVGYELLYRPSAEVNACTIDRETASSTVFVNALLDLGLGRLTDGQLAFVNCTADFFISESFLLLPRERVILELLEGIEVTPALLAAMQKAKQKGYRMALDDFVYSEEQVPLLECVHIVKVDFMSTAPEDIRSLVAKLKPFEVDLVAEKIETHEDFKVAYDLGCEYFQGYFFARPQIVRDRSIPSTSLQVLKLLSELEDDEIDFRRLEKLITHDVSMSVRILRYLNSASLARAQPVSSIGRAIALVGLNQIRKWVRMIAVSGLAADKPSELVKLALVRARFCEQVGLSRGMDAAQAFTCGLLSVIDAILDRPMVDIISQLNLSSLIKAALTGDESNPFSALLQLSKRFERGTWDDGDSASGELEADAYLHALECADVFYRNTLTSRAERAA